MATAGQKEGGQGAEEEGPLPTGPQEQVPGKLDVPFSLEEGMRKEEDEKEEEEEEEERDMTAVIQVDGGDSIGESDGY